MRFIVNAKLARRVAGALSVICCLAGSAAAQTKPASNATAIQRGNDTFQHSCAVCHGDRGNGKGPAAPAFTSHPTDLTTLARRTGKFPAAEVEGAIRGTSSVVAHGTPTMMVWGTVFLADANGRQAEADKRIADLVAFIESIQAK